MFRTLLLVAGLCSYATRRGAFPAGLPAARRRQQTGALAAPRRSSAVGCVPDAFPAPLCGCLLLMCCLRPPVVCLQGNAAGAPAACLPAAAVVRVVAGSLGCEEPGVRALALTLLDELLPTHAVRAAATQIIITKSATKHHGHSCILTDPAHVLRCALRLPVAERQHRPVPWCAGHAGSSGSSGPGASTAASSDGRALTSQTHITGPAVAPVPAFPHGSSPSLSSLAVD